MTVAGSAGSRGIEVRNYLSPGFSEDVSRDVREGMRADRKFLSSKYFYDGQGSVLFEKICRLPEYYLTRTELSILEENGARIMETLNRGDLVEIGSGANWKVRRLLDPLKTPVRDKIRYVPVDVSEPAIRDALQELVRIYPGLKVLGIVADFTQHLHVIPDYVPRLIVFFGSTIGNFGEEESRLFLEGLARTMKPEDRFLIGLDMLKPKAILEAAYNDAQGVTEAFNKNILKVINNALNADFDTSSFEHVAFFNEEEERVEMHLCARRRMTVRIGGLGLSVNFKKGESIHTEVCRKFSRDSAMNMFSEAGLSVERWFTDSREWFSLVELKPQ